MSVLLARRGIMAKQAAGSTFLSDPFTDTATTALASHTAAVGGLPSKHTNYGTGAAVISDANRAWSSTANPAVYLYTSASSATAEFDVDLVVYPASQPTGVGAAIVARADVAASTFYLFRWAEALTDDGFSLYKVVATTFTLLGSFPATVTNGVPFTITAQVRDATKKLFVDGVERISTTDNAITAAGKVGVWWDGPAGSDTTGLHLDALTARNV